MSVPADARAAAGADARISPAEVTLLASVFLIAACGSAETRWVETIIVGACLTAFCSLLFPYALGLPLQLLPTFLIR